MQIGEALNGNFPVIDLGNAESVVSIKSLNVYANKYSIKDEDGNPIRGMVDTDEVAKQIVDYYDTLREEIEQKVRNKCAGKQSVFYIR